MLLCVASSLVGDRTLAQDIVQQAAVVGLERLDTFEVGTNFGAWMVRIVRNTALNEVHKRVRQRTTPTDPADMEHAACGRGEAAPAARVLTGSGELAKDQEAFDDRTCRALMALEEAARACLLLRVVGGFSYRQIALALDMPEGTAMSHVHRARRAMASSLMADERGTDGSDGTASSGRDATP